MSSFLLIWAVLAGLLGCSGPSDTTVPVPIEGSTYRIGPNTPTEGSELTVEILRDRRRCARVFRDEATVAPEEFPDNAARIQGCLPRVDRSYGEVHLAFRLSDPERIDKTYLLPLEKEDVFVSHRGRDVQYFNLIQHEPTQAGQLFIFVIDHSSSMQQRDEEGVTRMERVSQALWVNRDVFLPRKTDRNKDQDYAIAMLRFVDKLEGLGGENPNEVSIITSPPEFRQGLTQLGGVQGWTHMYKAVEVMMQQVLENDKSTIRQYLNNHEMEPTVVLLTDGFNNTRPPEKCGDNAEKLQKTLNILRRSRKKKPSERPTLYTVGFGRSFRPGWKADPLGEVFVSPEILCGPYADYRIDGTLDQKGIDNVSLRWMAQEGGGKAFIKSDYRKLAAVFRETAPKRYTWYEVVYTTDPFFHRTSFKTRIKLLQYAKADSLIELHPSSWVDAPTGHLEPDKDSFVHTTSARDASAKVIPVLGLLVFLSFLGPAVFNGRRAVFRRASKSQKRT